MALWSRISVETHSNLQSQFKLTPFFTDVRACKIELSVKVQGSRFLYLSHNSYTGHN